MQHDTLSRRTFLATLGALPFASLALQAQEQRRKPVPIGLQLYSLRDDVKHLRTDAKPELLAVLRAVREMGYEGLEFWAPYSAWTADYAKDIRKELDAIGLRCFSIHTGVADFTDANLPHVIELNQILGSRYIVMAHPGQVTGPDGWKRTAETLAKTHEKLRPLGMGAGFHNHLVEFREIPPAGTRPMDIITEAAARDFHFQLDTATCMAAGADPVTFIKQRPGRVKSYHIKDWSADPQKGFRVLLGEGDGPWKEIIEAAETIGGVEYYLIEQEGSRLTPLETAKRCLENFRQLRG